MLRVPVPSWFQRCCRYFRKNAAVYVIAETAPTLKLKVGIIAWWTIPIRVLFYESADGEGVDQARGSVDI